MIQKMNTMDIDELLGIWLKTNVAAHYFISEDYWRNQYQSVKEMLPDATIYVYRVKGSIVGFIGLMDTYIAGIFIDEAYQSLGYGKQLLDFAKTKNDTLTLNVYKKNLAAIRFYLKEQFVVINTDIDHSTGEIEHVMRWQSQI